MLSDYSVPILFLVFNRPTETKQVFKQIEKIRPKKLYVALDGPRLNNHEDKIKQKEIIEFIEASSLNARITWLKREKNLGCKMGVSTAIDWFFSQEEMGIILEDDCVPNKSFFGFMQNMLEKYKDDERIMMVTGTNYQLKSEHVTSDYFFSQHYVIWGWATWRRAWKLYDVKMKAWKNLKKTDALKHLTRDFFSKKHFESTFNLIEDNVIDTWDIQWVFTCLFNSGLCIVPRVNMISNIGIEGVHAKQVTSAHFRKTYILSNQKLIHPQGVFPDPTYDNSLHRDKSRQAVLRRMIFSRFRKSLIYPIYAHFFKK